MNNFVFTFETIHLLRAFVYNRVYKTYSTTMYGVYEYLCLHIWNVEQLFIISLFIIFFLAIMKNNYGYFSCSIIILFTHSKFWALCHQDSSSITISTQSCGLNFYIMVTQISIILVAPKLWPKNRDYCVDFIEIHANVHLFPGWVIHFDVSFF